jgi:hypothetical protein
MEVLAKQQQERQRERVRHQEAAVAAASAAACLGLKAAEQYALLMPDPLAVTLHLPYQLHEQ